MKYATLINTPKWRFERTHNPLVPCSTHGRPTSQIKRLANTLNRFFFRYLHPPTGFQRFGSSQIRDRRCLVRQRSSAESGAYDARAFSHLMLARFVGAPRHAALQCALSAGGKPSSAR